MSAIFGKKESAMLFFGGWCGVGGGVWVFWVKKLTSEFLDSGIIKNKYVFFVRKNNFFMIY